MKIFDSNQIRQTMNLDKDLSALIQSQRQAFIDFSNKLYEVPLPMQLRFPANSGECHIKAGFKKNGEVFVIKVSSGFYENSAIRLPPGDGAILIFCQKTGLLLGILSDGGWLTTLRTALAGIVAASVTPWEVNNVGVIGTGEVACLIQNFVKKQYKKANVHLWGRDPNKTQTAASAGTHVCASVQELLAQSDVVLSATAATEAIIKDADISGKKHMIVLGADDAHKQECDPTLFKRSHKVIVDSKVQTRQFGDSFHALAAGLITAEQTVELGETLQTGLGADLDLIMTDLTGIAAQDAAIAEFVLQRLDSKGN